MKRNVLQGALLGLVFAILLSISSLAKADVAVYRLYNRQNGEHLYTTDINERDTLYFQHGWGYEGDAWTAPEEGTPVYRLYNKGLQNHLYTSDMNEINVLTSRHGWTKDNGGRPVFYSGGNVNIYRVYNQKLRGLHHWTTDSNEYNVLPGHGWSQEGVKFKATYTGRQIRTHFFDPYARVIEGYVENSDIITLKAEDAYDWADYVINDPESDFSGFNSFEIITIKASNGGITHSVQFSY